MAASADCAYAAADISKIRNQESCPAPAPAPSPATVSRSGYPPPLDSERGWTRWLWSKTNLLKWLNCIFFLVKTQTKKLHFFGIFMVLVLEVYGIFFTNCKVTTKRY